jgi:hypothetical protein
MIARAALGIGRSFGELFAGIGLWLLFMLAALVLVAVVYGLTVAWPHLVKLF